MSMKFHIQEGTLDLPKPHIDRTTNVLMPADGVGISIVVTRDVLEAGESLELFIERQLKKMKSYLSGFKSNGQVPLAMQASSTKKMQGYLLKLQFKQSGVATFQQQVVMQLPASDDLLIFTASTGGATSAADEEYWQKILHSFRLREGA
ncbi:hypothetical protein ABIE32_003538 [Comamonas sp. 4034]